MAFFSGSVPRPPVVLCVCDDLKSLFVCDDGQALFMCDDRQINIFPSASYSSLARGRNKVGFK
jgi:hypothetical protein